MMKKKSGHEMQSINWKLVHQRMKDTENFFAAGSRDEEVLLERAKKLAVMQETTGMEERGTDLVVFRLGDACYGVETSWVSEVCFIREAIPVPGVPAFILGVVNLRGRIVSLVSLQNFLQLSGEEIKEPGKVIVLRMETMEFAVPVQEIEGFRTMPTGEILAESGLGDIRLNRYIKGVTRESMIILDGRKILADDSMLVCDEG